LRLYGSFAIEIHIFSDFFAEIYTVGELLCGNITVYYQNTVSIIKRVSFGYINYGEYLIFGN